MLVITHYFKKKGERAYRRQSKSISKNSDIREYLGFFPTSSKKRNPDNVVKTKYSNFGRKFTRIVKNKRTGNSGMLVLEEKF